MFLRLPKRNLRTWISLTSKPWSCISKRLSPFLLLARQRRMFFLLNMSEILQRVCWQKIQWISICGILMPRSSGWLATQKNRFECMRKRSLWRRPSLSKVCLQLFSTLSIYSSFYSLKVSTYYLFLHSSQSIIWAFIVPVPCPDSSPNLHSLNKVTIHLR